MAKLTQIQDMIAEKVPYFGRGPSGEVATHQTISGKTVEDRPPTPYETFVLMGLQSKQVYQGTVPGHVKRHRRAQNKQARLSRRINRGS